jgi:hypothetical protein
MKFLIMATPRRLQLPPVGMIETAKAWLNAEIASKRIDCCYGFVTGGGVCVMNADSHEAVTQWLMEYPAFMGSDWKVEPLCDINHSLDQVSAMVKRMTV